MHVGRRRKIVLKSHKAEERILNLVNDVPVVYYESIKRELKIRPIYECRCDERLQTKAKEFTRPTSGGMTRPVL